MSALEWFWNSNYNANPALLCGTIYGTHLAKWDEAMTIAEGLIAMDPVAIPMNVRVNAFRLLARCHHAKGDNVAARDALDKALSEARIVKYVWTVESIERELSARGE